MKNTKVYNMESAKGNKIANQFIIETCEGTFFQSYNSIIVKRFWDMDGNKRIQLDPIYWDYSVTTSRYRNIFLNEKKSETEKKIESGEYELVNLNG